MWNKCKKCGIFVDNKSRCGQNAAAFCVGEQPHRRSTKKAARGRSMRVSPTQSRKESRGDFVPFRLPLAGCRDSVPAGVWGNAPTVPRQINSYYFQIQLRHLLAPFPFWRPLIPLSVALLRCVSFTLARMKNSRRILAHFHLEIVSKGKVNKVQAAKRPCQ